MEGQVWQRPGGMARRNPGRQRAKGENSQARKRQRGEPKAVRRQAGAVGARKAAAGGVNV